MKAVKERLGEEKRKSMTATEMLAAVRMACTSGSDGEDDERSNKLKPRLFESAGELAEQSIYMRLAEVSFLLHTSPHTALPTQEPTASSTRQCAVQLQEKT
jgi:hypothetical protein